MTKLFNKLNLIFYFIVSFLFDKATRATIKKAFKFLWTVSKQTDTKIDNDVIYKLAVLTDFIDVKFVEYDNKENLEIATKLTDDTTNLNGFEFKYNTENDMFDVSALGFLDFSYSPNDGSFYLGARKIL